MKRTLISKILAVAILSIVLIGCRKNKQTQESAEIAQQNSIAEVSSNEIQNIADEAGKGPAWFNTYDGDCVTVTYDTVGGKKTITIDFGTTNCLCEDGKERRGKVIVEFEGTYNELDNVITTTTDNYFVNDHQVEGIRTATNQSNSVYKVNADVTITLNGASSSLTWVSERTRTLVSGQDTPLILTDNVYEISGTAKGETAEGKDYTFETVSNLVVQLGCRYIKSGQLKLTSSHLKEDAIIDYGDGTCDNKATLTYGKKVKELTL